MQKKCKNICVYQKKAVLLHAFSLDKAILSRSNPQFGFSRDAQVAELVDALVSNTNGKPCRFDPGPGY